MAEERGPKAESKLARIAVFASGEGSNLRSLYEHIKDGRLSEAELALVISNNSRSGALEFARSVGVPSLHLSSVSAGSDIKLTEQMLKALKQAKIDLIVLAGYMKRLPDIIVQKYHRRILNIHPALLPEFGGKDMFGLRVHEAVLASGRKLSGATVHFVIEEYDEGEIILQRTCAVLEGDTAQQLQERVLRLEHELLPEAIGKVLRS